jgi:protoporphyrinogen oxidase
LYFLKRFNANIITQIYLIFDACDDIAIIGAGISGSYAAWRMRERNQSISLYEYSDRIGGKCYTVQLKGIPDVNVELGAMRFMPHGNLIIKLRELMIEEPRSLSDL